MDAEIQASLEAVIDPDSALASASLSPAPSPTPSKSSKPKSTPKSITKTKPPRASIVRNSAADYRRREANRLAAERSRSRTAEKYSTLGQTFKVLQDENERLRIQIAELENGARSNESQNDHILVPDSQAGGESQQAEGEGEGHEEVSTTHEQEQEAHSNTILAALTGITGVDFTHPEPHTENDEDHSWMQGMDSGLDAETSGRLAELAVVATESGQDQQQDQNQDQDHSNPFILDHSIEKARSSGHPLTKTLIPSPVNNPIIALAAAINTEIESIIMEDLALTKAAIASIEKQIEALAAKKQVGPDQTPDNIDNDDTLPQAVLFEDIEKLSIHSTEYTKEIDTVQSTLPQLHEGLIRLRDEKTHEEKKVVDLVNEVRKLEITDEGEKSAFMSGLKALGGYVETLLSDAQEGDLSYATGSYSTPAIARRRRGRPPKGDISRTFYQSFLLKHSPSSKSDAASENYDKSKVTRQKGPRRTRKSRLNQEVDEPASKDDDGDEAKGTSQAQAQAQSTDQDQNQEQIQSDQNHDQDGENEIDQEEATAEAVNRAEAFILSQLASQSQDHEGGEETLDQDQSGTTSFVDLLPAQAQAELERQVKANANQGITTSSGSAEQNHLTDLSSSQSQNGQISESVLARLKKGPPGSCDICMRTSTTAWRKLNLGEMTLKVCNACGLYHKRFGVIRPPELWDDGNAIRRRRAGPRNSTAKEQEEGDGERPNKRSKRTVKAAEVNISSNITEDGAGQGNDGGVGEGVQLDIQEDDEGRRAEFNAAIMEGLTAINAVPDADEQEHDGNGNGNGNEILGMGMSDLDVQMGVE
uniref:GATA-type domain-containing protein n=1 Tax=Kwoniella bestiolae CBS 10118 TaxID=1296100 RepID=A0A1B9FWG5_9TREE|nr:hypothetical protein I302_07459 [Kwoniella bestiolae CBS 10118]OCF23108.1 hypothetical protein I302_07459 [Kwoniella bestiolae CBS 10118]